MAKRGKREFVQILRLLEAFVSEVLIAPSERVDGGFEAPDQPVAGAQAQGVSSLRRLLGQLLTSLVSTSAR